MSIKFNKRMLKPEVWDYVKDSYPKHLITYWVDKNYRKAVNLVEWLKNQKIIVDNIPSFDSYDKQVIACLEYVRSSVKYKSDQDVWSVPELWQEGQLTLDLKTGDCEDGAILLYLLCRSKGVPANRLMIFAGDVNGGGHCWLGYRPEEYPLNWVFLDWCYWYNPNSVTNRPMYAVIDSKIYRDDELIHSDKYYFNIWFGFNEEQAHKVLNYKR